MSRPDSSGARIRIAHCLEQVRSGGVERRRLSLVRRLDPARFEQMVICTEALPSLRAQFEQAGCRVEEIGAMKRGLDWPKVRAASDILRNFKPDIVHGAVFEGVIAATIGGKLARVPVIVAEEIIAPVGRRWTGHVYYRLLTGLADKVIAISGAVSDYLINTIHLPRSKVRFIYNGVAAGEPATAVELAEIRRSLGIPADAPVIGTLGRLAGPAGQPPDSHKRISDAIAAMLLIRNHFPNAKLVIVGDGPDRDYLQRRVAMAGLEVAVLFAGYQSRVRPYLECMDVLIHPAKTEGLPLALVEAMFASRPIVATDVAGSNEVVANGETGFLVPVYSSQSLAERTIELLENPQLRARMGAAGLERARTLFSEDRYVREVGDFYEELVADRRGRH